DRNGVDRNDHAHGRRRGAGRDDRQHRAGVGAHPARLARLLEHRIRRAFADARIRHDVAALRPGTHLVRVDRGWTGRARRGGTKEDAIVTIHARLALAVTASISIVAPAALATSLPVVGSLSIQFVSFSHGPSLLPPITISGTGVAVVNGSGGGGHL